MPCVWENVQLNDNVHIVCEDSIVIEIILMASHILSQIVVMVLIKVMIMIHLHYTASKTAFTILSYQDR